MVTARARPQFKPADLVKYKGDGEHIILSSYNILGFNKYQIMNIENGVKNEASTHELEKIHKDILKDEPNEEFDMIEIKQKTQPRFKSLGEEQINEIAKKKSEATIDRQTAWAVHIIKGKFV